MSTLAKDGLVILGFCFLTLLVIHFAEPDKTVGVYHTAAEMTCAVDRRSQYDMAVAITGHDEKALAGLVERGKILRLAAGTRFDVSADEHPWAWGVVRSGSNIGRGCYLPDAVLTR